MPVEAAIFLLSHGLSVAKAPYPRERFIGFGVLGACIGALTGSPVAIILGAAAMVADAKAAQLRKEGRNANGVTGYEPPYHYGPPGGWRR